MGVGIHQSFRASFHKRRKKSRRDISVVDRVEHAPQDVAFDGERIGSAILRLARGAMLDDILQAEIGIARGQCTGDRENNRGRGYRAMDRAFPATTIRSAIRTGANNSVSEDATASVSGRDAHRFT